MRGVMTSDDGVAHCKDVWSGYPIQVGKGQGGLVQMTRHHMLVRYQHMLVRYV